MSDETTTTTTTETEEVEATPAERTEITLEDGTVLDDSNKLRDDADGTVLLEGGKLIDAPANQPGGQFDTSAGNADSDAINNITSTTPIGTPANDQPDLRPVGADKNVLETPDAPATDPSVTTVEEQPNLESPDGRPVGQPVVAVGDSVGKDNTETVSGTGDSTDANYTANV